MRITKEQFHQSQYNNTKSSKFVIYWCALVEIERSEEGDRVRTLGRERERTGALNPNWGFSVEGFSCLKPEIRNYLFSFYYL